jgi:uncharacterized protein
MNNIFECEKCGTCCTKLDKNPLYKELDSGDGTCIFFNRDSRLCSIYEKRPDICNVNKGYELFKDVMTKDEFYKLNNQMCNILRGN